MLLFANNARTTLRADITAASPVLYIAIGTGALFPTPADGDSFLITLQDATGRIEVMEVKHRNGDQFEQVLRGLDGTTAKTFAAGTIVSMRVTAELLRRVSADQLRGQYNGVAPLDSNGLIPEDFLPLSAVTQDAGDARYVQLSLLGQPNQPARLNNTGVLNDDVIPVSILRTAAAASTYVRQSTLGQPNGPAQLGANGKLPADAMAFAAPDLTPYAPKANPAFTGAATFAGTASVAGKGTFGSIESTGATKTSTLEVTGAATFAGAVAVKGGASRGKLTVSTAAPSGTPGDGDEWAQIT